MRIHYLIRFPLRFSIRFPSPLSTMDDLPRPKHMDSNPLKVPFLAGVNYDGNGFESPQKMGITRRNVPTSKLVLNLPHYDDRSQDCRKA